MLKHIIIVGSNAPSGRARRRLNGFYIDPRRQKNHGYLAGRVWYGFEKLKHYEGLLIKPSRRVKEEFIIKEWPEIQRILVSLGLKSTTQRVIVGKLSSNTRKNRTKRAMWELDTIFRSIYLLKYVDNVVHRQNVQRALNRGEAYHQLRRAISHEHFGKFRVETESEQNLWNEYARLVANAIIFYNTYLLNRMIDQMAGANKFDLVERIKKVSPIAWRHVNLSGRFNLINQNNPIDIDQMIARLEKFLLKSDD